MGVELIACVYIFMNADRSYVGAEDILQDTCTQILSMSLRHIRCNSLFQSLPAADQRILVDNVWHELFVLHASHWPLDVTAVVTHCKKQLQVYTTSIA